MTQSQIKLTLNPKLELPWIMISLRLLMSRVVTYKMTWHRKPFNEEVQVNTNNQEENKIEEERVAFYSMCAGL